jgi:endonuclease I
MNQKASTLIQMHSPSHQLLDDTHNLNNSYLNTNANQSNTSFSQLKHLREYFKLEYNQQFNSTEEYKRLVQRIGIRSPVKNPTLSLNLSKIKNAAPAKALS